MRNVRVHMLFLFIIIVSIAASTGCSDKNEEDQAIAYISSSEDSAYAKTFKELNLGVLFDFNFKLTKADTSWIDIWVEGYSNGEAFQPFPLTELSYGLSPNPVDEGKLGFGIINRNTDKPLFFLYSAGVSTNPQALDNNILINNGISGMEYVVSSTPVKLEYGEELILAAFRQGQTSLEMVSDYQDPNAVKKMIKKDSTVLLLKMKITEK